MSIRAITMPDLEDPNQDHEIGVPDNLTDAEAIALARKVVDEFYQDCGAEDGWDGLSDALVHAGFIDFNWVGKVSTYGFPQITEVYE